MNIINEFFVSFILIKLYFKFKVCRKIKFPLLWKFYFSKWKFYFSADSNVEHLISVRKITTAEGISILNDTTFAAKIAEELIGAVEVIFSKDISN
ncbi:hypothetical protein V2009_000213 [Campylobacter jejuni]